MSKEIGKGVTPTPHDYQRCKNVHQNVGFSPGGAIYERQRKSNWALVLGRQKQKPLEYLGSLTCLRSWPH
ncbi:MAG: hypothetical protein Ct9H90mP27_1530 [Gammaproteobacteria bacterium]|nr:MAG: hypothetical protein Ct9H90mP27_1530 [Gammaproteobacteria bacterium]